MRTTKHTLRGSETRTIDDALTREASVQAMTFTTADAGTLSFTGNSVYEFERTSNPFTGS